ncbi:MAG: hypothetical protein CMG71_00600 [Candidatus Marinimicrobia bacterium]|nr:hypothetical protein [Candidatus Neomarinimicrobiota bacterium]|tara:strand:+ start:5561 stop:6559 length:999 start_codon:yes stop_codon:yes gene_type:complete
MRRLLAVLLPFFFCFSACATVSEHHPVEIVLAEEFTKREPEYSGLAWAGQDLILLPQFPDRFPGDEGGNLLAVPKKRIENYLSGANRDPIVPRKITFNDNGVSDAVPGFEGFEALVADDNHVYLTIEAKEGEGRRGYIVSGSADWTEGKIRLNRSSLKQIQFEAFMSQMSFESLLLWNELLVTMYEANGSVVTDSPRALVFDQSFNELQPLFLPSIEYRITDATAVDEDGKFWIINYFYPGEEKLKPAVDPIAERYGRGSTHRIEPTVERLLQLELGEEGISFTERPPIQLSLMAGEARNWEGIVTLDDRGFLLISDTYPTTILSFVSLEPR